MVEVYTALFAQSSGFFSLPEESSQKTSVKAISGPAASEEGYSNITDEKSILTIKTSSHCPVILQEEVKTAWKLTGTLLSKILESIAYTLDLEPDVFSTFADPCVSLPQHTHTPTLLRMFRYDRPPGPEAKVNAERHKDLGLLSLVVGHSPGLQVLEAVSGMWVPIEGDQALPAASKARSGGLTATLLVGETLGFLTRGRYKPGVHGVVCASMEAEMHRYSIVFALRPAVAPIFTQRFESEIVGKFEPEEQADGESSFELFERIRKSHWNVNITPEIREMQREAQRQRKLASDETSESIHGRLLNIHLYYGFHPRFIKIHPHAATPSAKRGSSHRPKSFMTQPVEFSPTITRPLPPSNLLLSAHSLQQGLVTTLYSHMTNPIRRSSMSIVE